MSSFLLSFFSGRGHKQARVFMKPAAGLFPLPLFIICGQEREVRGPQPGFRHATSIPLRFISVRAAPYTFL